MNPVSPLPAFAVLLAAFATAALIAWRFGPSPVQGRFAALDGLRGFLALFVFLHHASIWYFYARTGLWRVPPSNLYTHFGQSSVALFFMITGFLFFSKLLDARSGRLDWGRLFISRFLRLVPLYLFAMFLLFSVVALLSNGVLHETLPTLFSKGMRWLGFTILGAPDLNGVAPTSLIVAWVYWSLPYEWFFYASLPLLALTVQVRPPLPYLILGIAGAAGFYAWHPQSHHVLSFLGGIAAALLVRMDIFRRFAGSSIASFLLLGLLAIVLTAFPSAYGFIPLLLLSLSFSLIAGGNGLFGILVNSVSRTLGEMAYSIYLLHGIVLYFVLTFIIGPDMTRSLSPLAYWMLVVGIAPVLVVVSFCTFRFIERPAMQSTPAVAAWLRSRLTRSAKSPAAAGTS